MPSLFLVYLAACAGGTPDASRTAAGSPTDSTVAPKLAHDGGSGNEPPFAESSAEATTMISDAVDSKRRDVGACVRDYRARRNLLHERVAVSFGIDQDGRLLGVTSKGKEDAELKACVQQALAGARFPRSHAGVITVTKSYEERLQ